MASDDVFSFFFWPRGRGSMMFVAVSMVAASAIGCGGQAEGGDSPSTAGTQRQGTGGSGSGGSTGGAGGSSGGASGSTGGSSGGSAGGASGSAGGGSATGGGGTGAPGPVGFNTPMQGGSGNSANRYVKADVTREGINYYFMANGWGPGFQSQTVSWNGTSFTVESMQGARGPQYQPASYPTVFCGVYSDSHSKDCGLPRAITDIASLRTGWRWNPNGNSGQYNAAYDVWLGNGTTIAGHAAFLMVWLRDPPGQQPAGALKVKGVSVTNAPGSWDVWSGVVSGKPCISYVRSEGQDSLELEFDVMDFVRDVPGRSLSLPGTHVLSVAVGFEIWSGPITKLESQDFYLSVK